MTAEDLFALGATSCAAAIDLDNVNIAKIQPDGSVVLTPEGEAMIADREHAMKPVVTADPAPAKAPRKAKPVPVPMPVVEDDFGLSDAAAD